jgi:hypothetical protein
MIDHEYALTLANAVSATLKDVMPEHVFHVSYDAYRNGAAWQVSIVWRNTGSSPCSDDVRTEIEYGTFHVMPPEGYGRSVRNYDLGQCGVIISIFPLVKGLHT